jgi:hypothetical protein
MCCKPEQGFTEVSPGNGAEQNTFLIDFRKDSPRANIDDELSHYQCIRWMNSFTAAAKNI